MEEEIKQIESEKQEEQENELLRFNEENKISAQNQPKAGLKKR